LASSSRRSSVASRRRRSRYFPSCGDLRLKKVVDVTGIEPVTPCLQMRTENTMWLSFLAFTYVVIDGF